MTDFKQKDGERYWSIFILIEPNAFIKSSIVGEYPESSTERLSGNCYRSEEEARKALNKKGLREIS